MTFCVPQSTCSIPFFSQNEFTHDYTLHCKSFSMKIAFISSKNSDFSTNILVCKMSCPKNVMSVMAEIIYDNYQTIYRIHLNLLVHTAQDDCVVIPVDNFRLNIFVCMKWALNGTIKCVKCNVRDAGIAPHLFHSFHIPYYPWITYTP